MSSPLSTQKGLISKRTQLANLDSEFHYVPSSKYNSFKPYINKLNDPNKKNLNCISYEQSNSNSNSNTNTSNIVLQQHLASIDPNHPNSILNHYSHYNNTNNKQLHHRIESKTNTNFHQSQNLKLKLLSTSREAKYPPPLLKPSNTKFQQIQCAQITKFLFKSFLTNINTHYPALYSEFYSYCLLSSSSITIGSWNDDIANQARIEAVTKLFKNIFTKFNSKITIKPDDLTHNTQFLNTIESLLNDYYNFTLKSKGSFIRLFFERYKEVIVANYGIFSRQVNDKIEGVKQYEEGISKLKETIDDLNATIFDLNSRINLIQLDNQKYQNIVTHQKDEIEGLKEEIEQLKNTIQIKNYELMQANRKNEEQLKDALDGLDGNGIGVIGNNNTIKANEYEERLDIDKLLKNRLERIKFNTFKKDILNKNKKKNKANDKAKEKKDDNIVNFNLNANTINHIIINNSQEEDEDDNDEVNAICNTNRNEDYSP